MNTLAPDRVHIFVYDGMNDQYAAMPGTDNRPTSDIRFASSSPLAQYFQQERLPLYLDGASLPPALKGEQARLALLGARLFISLSGKERPLGWIAMGSRLSGQPYTPQDLAFVENLCEQASLSLERAQTVSDLERRVQEMNALSRVSQGVNITLSFDDVLELIYAQTAQIIPAADFHITLYNKATDYFYYAFCVENRDRVEAKENKPLPPNSGLAQDIILKGRPLITQDYTRECQARNVLPGEQGVFAWMGVPLNAGAETIGTLSVCQPGCHCQLYARPIGTPAKYCRPHRGCHRQIAPPAGNRTACPSTIHAERDHAAIDLHPRIRTPAQQHPRECGLHFEL